jgi:hypothetical protein
MTHARRINAVAGHTRDNKRTMTSHHQQHGEQEEQRGQQRGGGGAGLGGRAAVLRTVPGVLLSFNTQNLE